MADQTSVHPDAVDERDQLLEDIERLGDRLRTLERELRESERMATLGYACAAVAHEFNNLLTPALGYAMMALESPEDADLTRKALGKAAASIEKASSIATSLLGVARGDEASDEQGGSCDIAEALDEAVSCLGRPLADDGIESVMNIDGGLEALMSPIAMEQVFLNLLLNARAALEPGQTIRIVAARSTWNTDGDRSACVRIEVSDNGPGLPRDVARAVFGGAGGSVQATRRSAPSRGSEGRAGLGLSICRRLVEEAGGRMSAEEGDGRGARFVILLPAADGASRNRSAA